MPQDSRAAPRKTPRQQRSKATVDAILEAAARILVQDGYEATTTRKVAEVAGVSIGSLYQYFPSKEALVTALAERQVERVLAKVSEALEGAPGAALPDVARQLAQGIIGAYAENPRLYQEVFEQGPRFGMPDVLRNLQQRIESIVRVFLTQQASALRPRNLDLATFVITRTIRGVVLSAATERPELFSDPELLDELSALMMGYLMP